MRTGVLRIVFERSFLSTAVRVLIPNKVFRKALNQIFSENTLFGIWNLNLPVLEKNERRKTISPLCELNALFYGTSGTPVL